MDELIDRAFRGQASPAQLAQLAEWRGAHPDNERHYRQLLRLLEAAASLRPGRAAAGAPPTADALIAGWRPAAAAPASSPPVLPLPVPPRGGAAPHWRRHAPWAVATAAVLLLVANTLHPLVGREGEPATAAEVVTGAGDIATVQLGDGSVVRLAPNSRLAMGVDGDARTVALDGRAFFSVARIEGRPFRVRTRIASATVLGTRFELVTGDADLQLIVVEGRVALEAPENRVEVGAGQASAVANRVAAAPTDVADAASALRWTGVFLAFQDTPLSDAAREIAATYGVRVAITDSTLARQTVTAVFTGRSLDAVLAVVCEVVNADCVRRAGEITVSPR